MSYTLKNIVNSPLKDKSSCKITSDYGERKLYNKKTKKYEKNFHYGIDMVGTSKVVSFLSGKVTSVRNSVKGYSTKYTSGNYITIDHGSNIISVYYHLKQNTIKVKKGDIVEKGTLIATMGKTGKVTGTHLHFGIKKSNKFVDPKPYILSDVTPNKSTNTEIIYIVKKGDTLSSIAKKYNTTWKKIYEKNKDLIGDNPNLIQIGWHLKI